MYRTHTCGELSEKNIKNTVTLAGWINSKRDHGNLMFIDLRDHYGLTQCVIENTNSMFHTMEKIHTESVITVQGEVVKRSDETINKNIPTGMIEVKANEIRVISSCDVLPILVSSDEKFPEDLRLKYRYIDLRREKLQKNIKVRSEVIKAYRDSMWNAGFNELQTPILTVSSPEGARDFVVPSRKHPGKFYALPQAPQQFKQLSMIAGFDKYFQIAPCFRDEDSRADRVLEFYQLDVEMSFATQDDVMNTMEPIVLNVFEKFKNVSGVSKKIDKKIEKITFADAMAKYGSDKPDLRNPLLINDVTNVFKDSSFAIFTDAIKRDGFVVLAIKAPNTAKQPRSFFDKLNDWAKEEGAKGLGYIVYDNDGAKGPIAKNLDNNKIYEIKSITSADSGDSVFFVCADPKYFVAQKFAGKVRNKLGTDLNLIDGNIYKFCWIVDFPFYEYNDDEKKIDFCHNPFSMPQGGLDSLTNKDPLDILAYQYDMVCNGFEICSGGVRNHDIETAYKAFEIAGYSREVVDMRFTALITAFKFGVPPHAGCAYGLERQIMLLLDEPNLREVILFPPNQKGEDLMMNAPSELDIKQLRELHIQVKKTV